jgi:hypothetical protein
VPEDDHDFSVSSVHYLRLFASRWDLCAIENGKVKLNEAGRGVYGEWAFLPTRYKQVTLDAFNVLPNLFQGILCIDLQRQKLLELEHPWSQNIRYTFADIVKGFIGAVGRSRRGDLLVEAGAGKERAVGLKSKYVFSPITDQRSLDRFRTLIWEALRQWDIVRKQIVGSNWPLLKEARVEPGLEALCPYCDPALRPTENKVRYCKRHLVFVDVPADPSKPITYTSLADWMKKRKIVPRS